MHKTSHLGALLQNAGFSFHGYIGRFLKVGFSSQCWILASIAAISILIAGNIDGTLFLNGRDVGLLEHSAIWTFVALQVALPFCILHSLKRLMKGHSKLRKLCGLKGSFLDSVMVPIREFLKLKDRESKLAATVVYSAGIAAFVWNTYQNQRPRIIVPYDFWDSNLHFFGFWLTRIYKLYLFGWLLPYIALIQIAILVVILGLIRRARVAGTLKLTPFNSDGVGGLAFIPGLITTPIIVTMLIGAAPTLAAFEVHRALDITPLMGLSILVLWAGAAYIVPIIFLRSDIVAFKREMIARSRQQQQDYYSTITDSQELDVEKLRKGYEAFDYFEKVCERIQAISNYPHLRRLLKFFALALTPTIISLALKLYDGLAPIIAPVLKKP